MTTNFMIQTTDSTLQESEINSTVFSAQTAKQQINPKQFQEIIIYYKTGATYVHVSVMQQDMQLAIHHVPG